jgi:formylglycine-generating enzyme required for sulfatase activity
VKTSFLSILIFFLLGCNPSPSQSPEQPTESIEEEPTVSNQESTLSELEQAINRARNLPAHNGDWISYIYEFADGVEMALVPVGCFVMGSTDEQIEYAMDELGAGDWIEEREQPANEVCFNEPFWIDRTEVTHGDFYRLGGHQANSSPLTTDKPVEEITWFEARDYCERQGKRLPTEAEWEYVARGVESLIFPWGDEFDGNLLNYCDENCENDWRDTAIDDGYRNTAPVGSYPNGASWVGALDMSGNVWEWVNTIYGIAFDQDNDFADNGERLFSYPYLEDDGRELKSDNRTDVRVLRGGSWHDQAFILRSSTHYGGTPTSWYGFVGFRCARDIED